MGVGAKGEWGGEIAGGHITGKTLVVVGGNAEYAQINNGLAEEIAGSGLRWVGALPYASRLTK